MTESRRLEPRVLSALSLILLKLLIQSSRCLSAGICFGVVCARNA
jgi:hypothetical protein